MQKKNNLNSTFTFSLYLQTTATQEKNIEESAENL